MAEIAEAVPELLQKEEKAWIIGWGLEVAPRLLREFGGDVVAVGPAYGRFCVGDTCCCFSHDGPAPDYEWRLPEGVRVKWVEYYPYAKDSPAGEEGWLLILWDYRKKLVRLAFLGFGREGRSHHYLRPIRQRSLGRQGRCGHGSA